ncbi:unnamed protein product [Microthlaspi erraticum]|uniref:RING-type domain-containing protein n=1 Tax=Microthlaspi erraticum TaxID=1685480 RepID=A0A6D2JIB3_9BRAS|nr:unnamed protein product [Microthlaspi erraticum]
MVDDSITDAELFHGRPISIDFVKKRKANWFWKLKQWKIDARRKQWIYQWKRANPGEDCTLKSLREKLITDRNTSSDRFSWKIDDDDDDDDETDLERASSASSPTSVLKSKEDDCFCCSKQVTEEDQEEAFDDAFDNFDGFIDALSFFENEDPKPKTEKLFEKEKSSSSSGIRSKRRKKKKSKECDDDNEKSECPICSEEMDETDLSFTPCPCGFRLCLFCHNKINENDGRCPNCREKYGKTSSSNRSGGEVSFQQRGRGTLRLSPSFRGLDRA